MLNIDPASVIIGAVGGPILTWIAKQAVSPAPRVLVGYLKNKVKALAVAGKIDAATIRLLKRISGAAFAWVDDEMPDAPGPEKMDHIIERAGCIPYVGALVRSNPGAARDLLQAGYDAVKAEAKAEETRDSTAGKA
jgi:hypothetical protein